MDFTLSKYTELLKSLKAAGYTFVTFHDYLTSINQTTNLPCRQAGQSINQSIYHSKNQFSTHKPEPLTPNPSPVTRHPSPVTRHPQRLIILRHDVDLKPQNSLASAKIEHALGIKGSYYFRMVPESFNVDIIKEIASLGHEIGYHYETMDTAGKCLSKTNSSPIVIAREERTKQPKRSGVRQSQSFREEFLADCLESKESSNEPGNKDCFASNACNDEMLIDTAYQQFCENLETLRNIADIKTICMHGSPRSKYDNKDIWKKYDYRNLGIIGEPYFDIDFNDFFYLTDTGRRWDGWRVSVRDKVSQQENWNAEGLVFKATMDIINAAQKKSLPPRIMITVHPQRWTNSPSQWIIEYLMQNLKNIVKGIIVSRSIRLWNS